MKEKKMKKTLLTSAVVAASCSFMPAVVSAEEKPNILLIFADDLGYGDAGYQGGKTVPTPNIDSIAHNGVQFVAGYVTAPVCSPSRAGLLSGRYQNRFGSEDNPGPFGATVDTIPGIPPSEKTIGERMQALGYHTGWIGKQHQGKHPRNNPTKRGFNEFYGFNNGAANYFKHKRLVRGTKPITNAKGYLTDMFGNEAVDFINRNHKKPFFLYVPFNAVHGPLQAPPKLVKKYAKFKPAKRQKLLAMLDSMDQNIGKMIKALKKNNIYKNTLIIFLSDNGGKPKGNFSFNTPLRGTKGQLFEGGIRIPFCMQWPDKIKAGSKYTDAVISLDVMPTSIAAAGGKVNPAWKLDGVNLLPYITGQKKGAPHKYLYWRFNFSWGIRDNDWKLVFVKGKKAPMLFNIAKDMCEKKNLIKAKPEVAAKLKKQFDQWASGMMKPQWGWQPSIVGHTRIKTGH
jgi:arylsulfatase A-like enzyme